MVEWLDTNDIYTPQIIKRSYDYQDDIFRICTLTSQDFLRCKQVYNVWAVEEDWLDKNWLVRKSLNSLQGVEYSSGR